MNDREQAIRNLSFPQFVDAFFQNVRFENSIKRQISIGKLPFDTIGEYLDGGEAAKELLLKVPNLGRNSLEAFDQAIVTAFSSDKELKTNPVESDGLDTEIRRYAKHTDLVSQIRTMYPLAFDEFLARYSEAPDDDPVLCASLEAQIQALNTDIRATEVVYRRFRGETLEEIGESLGLTRERIRQIEARFRPLLTDIYTEPFVRKALDAIMAAFDYADLPRHGEMVDFHPLLPMALRRVLLADRSAQGNGPLSGKERRMIAARLGLAVDEGEVDEAPESSGSDPGSDTDASAPQMPQQRESTPMLTQWVSTFLEHRGLSAPDQKRMLYGYNLSAEEFANLEDVLARHIRSSSFSQLVSRSPLFPALFVLFASEWWKREYSGGPWDWDPIVARLTGQHTDVSPQARSECVTRGLRYWGHEPLSEGRRFLGAIVAHGGMPMRLLAQGSGKLPGLLTHVIKFADRYQWNRLQILDGIQERRHLLPLAYRRPEIAGLLADFTEAVLLLKREYRLGDVADPIAYLDQHVADWKQRFPISPDNAAAQNLLVGLVRVAAAQKASSSQDLFRCERRLVAEGDGDYVIEAHLFAAPRADGDALAQIFGLRAADNLPRYFTIDVEGCARRSFLDARLVLGAQIPAVSLSGRRIVERCAEATAEHMLILRSEQGDLGERFTIPGGGALPDDDPWVFVQREDEIMRFVAAGAARLPDTFAIAALSPGWQIEIDDAESEILGRIRGLGAERRLYRIAGSFVIHQSGIRYHIRLGQTVESGEVYQWSGSRLPDAHGKPVFRGGTPGLHRVIEDRLERVPLTDQEWRRQGTAESVSPRDARGPIEVLIRRDDEVVGRQRIVVLPPDARIAYVSGKLGKGSVHFVRWGLIDLAVAVQPGLHTEIAVVADQRTISLEADGEPPGEFRVLVRWPGSSLELPLRLAFPATGGRFMRGDGTLVHQGERVALRDLVGMRLQVFDTNPAQPKRYELVLALASGAREQSLNYPVALDAGGRAEVRLIDYQRHIESLLGMTDLLDSAVTVRLMVGMQPATEILVGRYTLAMAGDMDEVRIEAGDLAVLTLQALAGAEVLAYPLVAELAEPVRLTQRCSEGTPVGAWDAGSLDAALNPWLIYSSEGSSLQFRPTLWIAGGRNVSNDIIATACLLGSAMLEPDARTRIGRLHDVVRDMSLDLAHPSWPLLERLWTTFHHLPLPALDLWRVVAKRPRAVLGMLLRLEMDAAAIAETSRRFRNEAGWIPELTSVLDIHEATTAFWCYWAAQLPESMLGMTGKTLFVAELDRRLRILASEIPSLELLVDLVLFELTNQASESLQAVWDVNAVKSDVLVRSLWQSGQESLGNTLLFLVNVGRDHWPERRLFESALSGLAEALGVDRWRQLTRQIRRLFWPQEDDFKFSVANMPILCALWSATSTSRKYWSDAGHRIALKRVKDFDPVWFESAFRHAYAALLSLDGVLEPECFIDFPD